MPLDNRTPEVRNNPMPKENKLVPENQSADSQKDVVIAAHDEAIKDIEADPDLNTTPDPLADLDEGESARVGDERDPKNDAPDPLT